MSIKDINAKLKGNRAIRKTAKTQGITEEEVRFHMQEALDAAWAAEDPAIKAFQRTIFPAGKPTLEEFITAMADMAVDVEARKRDRYHG